MMDRIKRKKSAALRQGGKMRIPKEMMAVLKKQLDADCCIGGGMQGATTAKNGAVFQKAPRFPEKAYMTDASYGELLREQMEGRTGIRPRIYEGIDLFFRGIICMGQVRILAAEEILGWCEQEYGSMKNPEWFCQFSSLRRLDGKLRQHGRRIEDVRLNFLPCDNDVQIPAPCRVRWLEAGELAERRDLGAFRHAICGSALTPDVLAVAAVKEGRIVGIAGATEDCDMLWQIGVDVERGQMGLGTAAALVCLMKNEILKRGKIPFYSTSQSHIISMDTAVSAGFLPAWSEIYVTASLPVRGRR